MKATNLSLLALSFTFATILISGARAQGSVQTDTPHRSLISTAYDTQPPPPALFDLNGVDIKFNLATLMKTLRDSRHEGWVLSAYRDPETSRPLIGAGFSLDVPATEHVQQDLFNPHPFLEPSSAQLWQAAGLEPERLLRILIQFHQNLEAWKTKKYRRKIKTRKMPAELSEEEATRLLNISAQQAIYNARAYCRSFDMLAGPQQLALSQLVFQMGVNLEKFVNFLSMLNGDELDAAVFKDPVEGQREHWRAVQQTLIDSQWAHRYTSRAVAVIAMFDPDYSASPGDAELRVQAALPLPVKHHRVSATHHRRRRR